MIDPARLVVAAGLSTRCPSCGRVYPALERACRDCPDAFLRAEYAQRSFEPAPDRGIFRYIDWLPPAVGIDTQIGPTVYRAEALALAVGINDLYVGYNGYAPEVGAHNPTGSFKDFEAIPTLLFLREHGVQSIVLASAGNTARAFAYAATLLDFTVHIVVPERCLDLLWCPVTPSERVRLTIIQDSADYALAIECARLIEQEFGILGEGGARNIARRDGMGTSLLEYARVVRAMPHHYFQAIGSGTGGIAAWEAGVRLIGDGSFGDRPPVLNLAQNAPFTPIHDAWTHARPIRPFDDVESQVRRIDRIGAHVLANRNPPYGIAGGVRDALRATHGRTYAVTDRQAREAAEMFCRAEGLPIGSAAAVALGALMQAVGDGRVRPHEPVLFNMTGNDEALVARDYTLHPIRPALHLSAEQVTSNHVTTLYRHFHE